MIKSKIVQIINSFISLFNMRIIKLNSLEPVNLTKSEINPISAQYMFDQKSIVIEIDLKNGRTNNWFDLKDSSLDPGIFAIKNALKKNLKNEILYEDILNTLRDYRSVMKCENAAFSLNIDSFEDSDIKKFSWWNEIYPWDDISFEENEKNYPYQVKRNRWQNGMKILSNDPKKILEEDFKNSLDSHTKQYVNLLNDIMKQGVKFGSKYGYITAEIFISKNKFCWKPGTEGNHRTAVCAALGLKKIPVLITRVIRLDELEYWPNVIKGRFSKDQAKKIFFDIFNAKPKKINEDWIKKLLNKN